MANTLVAPTARATAIANRPIGPASGDGHGFCGDLPRQHGMNRVAQRIENRSVFLRNGGIQFPDI